MARPDLTLEDVAAILESWGYEQRNDSGTYWSHPDHDLPQPTQVRVLRYPAQSLDMAVTLDAISLLRRETRSTPRGVLDHSPSISEALGTLAGLLPHTSKADPNLERGIALLLARAIRVAFPEAADVLESVYAPGAQLYPHPAPEPPALGSDLWLAMECASCGHTRREHGCFIESPPNITAWAPHGDGCANVDDHVCECVAFEEQNDPRRKAIASPPHGGDWCECGHILGMHSHLPRSYDALSGSLEVRVGECRQVGCGCSSYARREGNQTRRARSVVTASEARSLLRALDSRIDNVTEERDLDDPPGHMRVLVEYSVPGRTGDPVPVDHVLELLVEQTILLHAPAGISFSFVHGWRNDQRKGER